MWRGSRPGRRRESSEEVDKVEWLLMSCSILSMILSVVACLKKNLVFGLTGLLSGVACLVWLGLVWAQV